MYRRGAHDWEVLLVHPGGPFWRRRDAGAWSIPKGAPEPGEDDAAGVALLGVSKDTAKKHQNFIAKHDLKAPLASDAEEGGLSDALGIWTEKQNYGRTYMGMVRTTYLIGPDGTIARIWDKVKVKDHAAQVLEAAKAL